MIAIANSENYPLKAIRAKCLDCAVDDTVYVRFCTCHGGPGGGSRCGLWPFRFGSKPAAARNKLGSAGEILLNPERMPPHDLPLEE